MWRDHDYGGFFHDAVIGMAVVGLDGRLQAVNPALCRMLGYREDELVGRSTLEITHPDDRQESVAGLERLVSGAAVTDQLLKRYVRPDGSSVSAIRSTTLLRDTGGIPLGLITQVVDVSALTELEETIWRSERRLNALVAHAPDLVLLLDEAGSIRYASPAAGRIIGYNPEELEGRSAFEFLHPDHHDGARRLLAEHPPSAGVGEPVVCRVRHRDGSWREVHAAATNMLDDPSVAALVFNVRDLTDYHRRLEAGKRRFQTLFANSWDMIALHDAEGRYLLCNPAVRRLGYEPDELVGTDPFDRIHPEDHTRVFEGFRRVVEGDELGLTVEYRFRHGDGSWRWVESIGSRLGDSSIGAVVTTTRDITEARRRARQQQAVAALGRDALSPMPLENLIGIALSSVAEILDAPRCHLVRFAEDGAHTTMSSDGPPAGPAPGPDGAGCLVCTEAFDWGDPTLLPPVRDGAGPFQAPGTRECTPATAIPVVPSSGPGGVLAVCTRGADQLTDDDTAFLETIARILAAAFSRQGVEMELRRQAVRDALTGLPNQTLLKDRLQRAISRIGLRGGSVAVLFIDLDNLKLINDSLGHSVGDTVVAAVADRLREAVSAQDTVARFGGDEFVVVTEDADLPGARDLADRIARAVAAPLSLAGRIITVTASIGCAVTDQPAASPESLLADADMAMYEAKNAGKNEVAVFTPALRRRTTDHLEAVSGIRHGLAAGEFRLHYQPIHDLTTGQVSGHEALLRWQHPTKGLVAPDQFIHYAETSGLIIPLGKWVLHTGCAQSAAWRRAGRPARVTINVSPRQLTGNDIAADVSSALRSSGADPDDIHLEVTESALIPDLPRARAALDSLHDLGVHLGLDDFGTGWSSLSQLSQLPFDFVKIDRSFVMDIENDPRTSALLESILDLCSTLGLRVIVEGVETESQLERLEHLGVRMAQGFLLGRPAPPAALV